MPAHPLPTVCSDVSLVDRCVFPLSSGVQPGALLLADVDDDGDAEIVVGADDGTLSVFKGRASQPLQVLTGFGPIVAIAHTSINATQTTTSSAPDSQRKDSNSMPTQPTAGTHAARSLLLRSPLTATSPPQPESLPLSTPPAVSLSPAGPLVAGSRLLVVNSEGDLFALEISQARMNALTRAAEAASADSRPNADDDDDRVPSAEWVDESSAADRREHYASSGFLASHQRFRVPINVSTMECCVTDEHAALSVVLGTLECSLHVYTLHAERPAEELALEAATAAAAMARAAAALAAQAREEEQQSGGGGSRSRGVFGSNSPVLSGGSRRGSLNGSGSVNHLSQLGPPVLPTSTSASKDGSPALRGRVILQSNHFAPIAASASGPSSSGPQIAAFNVARKLAPSGPLPPQPNLGSSVSATNAASSSQHSGASSTASSASHTRTNSPTLSSSILTAINQQQTPSPALQGMSTSSTPARSRARSPVAPVSPARSAGTKQMAPPPPAPASKVTWILRLELVRQLLKLPHPVHALSSIHCDQAPADWRQSTAMKHNASMTSLASDSEFLPPGSLPPGAFTLGADSTSATAAVASGSSGLTLPSNCPQLLPLWTLDATTLHVLPSKLFQRSQASQKKHTRAESGPGAATAALPPSATNARSISSAAHTGGSTLHGSSTSHHASLKDLSNLPGGGGGGGVVNSPSLNPRPVGRSGMSSMLQPSSSGSNSAIPSRKNSGAHQSSSLFHSPQIMGRPAPNASPKFGPQAPLGGGGMSLTNSPRFSFLTAGQQNASNNTFGQQQASMYSMSVSASPAFTPLASTPHLPALSLGAPVAVDPITTAPVSLLAVSPRLLLIALEEGAVLFDWLHGWAWALSFPRPSSALAGAPTATGPGVTSPVRMMRSTSSGSVGGLASSESLTSLSSITPAGVSAPSSTPPPILVAALTDAAHATSPPTAQMIAVPLVPPLQRTLSAPVEAVANAPAAALSTPQLRPAQTSSTGARAPQPAGINLSALNNTTGTANPTPVLPSPLRVTLPQTTTTTSQTPFGLTPMALPDADPALLSPGTTPISRSMTSSRNVSYANFGVVATPKLGATQAPGATTMHETSPAPAAVSSARWDVVRAKMCGDLQLPGLASEGSDRSSSGVFGVLDALGRVSVQHLAVQMQDESDDPTDSNGTSRAWYQYSLQLPGQFLALSSLPLSSADASAGSVLTACSLDGSVYFIPMAPTHKPPLPQHKSASAEDDQSSPKPFHVCRFQYPARVAAFRSGLYSLSAGQPSASLLLVTYQNELVIFPAALQSAGLEEWTHQWKWRQHRQDESDGVTASPATQNSVQTDASSAEGAELTSPATESLSPPAYSLSLESSRRTPLSAWREHDAAVSVDAAQNGATAAQEAPTSLSTLLKWTSSHPTDCPSAASLTPATAAPYLRDLQDADLVVLNEYRRLLRRKLGLPEEAPDDDANSEDEERSASGSRSGSDDEAAEGHPPAAQPSPVSRRGHHRRHGTGSSLGSLGSASPVLSHLQSSPLFAPFRHTHFSAGPMSLAAATSASAHTDADLPLLRSRSDPLHTEEAGETIPARVSAEADDREQSPSFWRKLMRRTK